MPDISKFVNELIPFCRDINRIKSLFEDDREALLEIIAGHEYDVARIHAPKPIPGL